MTCADDMVKLIKTFIARAALLGNHNVSLPLDIPKESARCPSIELEIFPQCIVLRPDVQSPGLSVDRAPTGESPIN